MLLTVYSAEWLTLCWCAVKKLLTHSLYHNYKHFPYLFSQGISAVGLFTARRRFLLPNQ